MQGDFAEWGVAEYLLALVADAINMGNWQRGGGKGPRPQAIERPNDNKSKSFGSDPIPIKDFNDWWDGA